MSNYVWCSITVQKAWVSDLGVEQTSNKFAALHRQYRRFHMNEKFSRRTETTNSHQVVMQVIQVIVTLQSNKDQFTLNLNSDTLFLEETRGPWATSLG